MASSHSGFLFSPTQNQPAFSQSTSLNKNINNNNNLILPCSQSDHHNLILKPSDLSPISTDPPISISTSTSSSTLLNHSQVHYFNNKLPSFLPLNHSLSLPFPPSQNRDIPLNLPISNTHLNFSPSTNPINLNLCLNLNLNHSSNTLPPSTHSLLSYSPPLNDQLLTPQDNFSLLDHFSSPILNPLPFNSSQPLPPFPTPLAPHSPIPSHSYPPSSQSNSQIKSLPRNPNVLHRNKACLSCRARKTKCDALKPICSSCKRLGPDQQSQCRYDQPPKWLESVVAPAHRDQRQVAALEQKLEALQHRLTTLRIEAALRDGRGILPLPSELPELAPALHPAELSSPSSATSSLPAPSSPLLPATRDWPLHLPPRQTVRLLLRAFFGRPLSPFTLVEPAGLQRRLDLPATDPAFPEPALVHAVCAVGAQYVSLDALGLPYWLPPDGPDAHHARWAERLLNDSLADARDPRRVLELAEAAVLCSQYYTVVGKPLMIWKSLGFCIRCCTLLGLNVGEQSDGVQAGGLVGWPDRVRGLDRAMNDNERHARTLLWWYAFCCDRMCAAAAGFAPTIEELDSVIPICGTSAQKLEPGFGQAGPSSCGGYRFECHHPLSDVFFYVHDECEDRGALQLLIKAAILLGKVTNTVYRRSHPSKTSQDSKRETEELSRLIKRFFGSIPEKFRNPFRMTRVGKLDACLLSAHALVHASLIQLHEDLVEQVGLMDEDLQVCVEASRRLVDWFDMVDRQEIEIGILLSSNPTLNFGLSSALRTQCRLIAVFEAIGRQGEANEVRLEVEKILCRLKRCQKLPVAGRLVGLIVELLDEPGVLLPFRDDMKSKFTIVKGLEGEKEKEKNNNREDEEKEKENQEQK